MSRRPIDRSPPLKRLRDEGYSVDVVTGYLVIRDVPYVDSNRHVKRGVLFAPLEVTNDVAKPPKDHQTKWSGDHPCNEDGSKIQGLGDSDLGDGLKIDGMPVRWNFSCKPKPADRYDDFHQKMAHYVAKISGPAQVIEPGVTAQSFKPYAPDEDDSVFLYEDTASSRADIVAIALKLKPLKVGIVGLGGTGSYVLDYLAKTHVREIHLFDNDGFNQHNAFRAPGAPSGEELEEELSKVEFHARTYSKMRRGIVPHKVKLTPENLHLLEGLDFVFLCMEGTGKRPIVQKLEAINIPFVDVGMGLTVHNESLRGQIRTTTSTPTKREHVHNGKRIAFMTTEEVNEYDKNIQVVELNALNAAFAVIKFKKLFGFYDDDTHEHFSIFVLAGAETINEDSE
ncbi:ThiF family adenylyltransferase [Mesorhizobium sp. M0030]|uniref:ThiF family adenylyltransferase n=1 Tax=Mesorhizobium sp. M0030 TaxID=2956851 RepID=UPI0033366620